MVAGSGDAFGSGGRMQMCIAVCEHASPASVDSGVLLVDCGATSLVALRRAGVEPQAVEAVVLTHLHGDHFAGLPFLILDGQFSHRDRDLIIAGPPGTYQRLHDAMETLFPGSAAAPRRFSVTVKEYADTAPGEAVQFAGFGVTPVEVRHAAGSPAYGLRIVTAEAVLAYSGDTEWTPALIDLANGADLFLCEGYSHRRIRWHLGIEDLARHRSQLGCRRLVLVHMSPDALDSSLDGQHAWVRAYDGWHTVLPSPGDGAVA